MTGEIYQHETKNKPKTDNELRDYLKQLFYLEYDFYNFVKQLTAKRIKYINALIERKTRQRS